MYYIKNSNTNQDFIKPTHFLHFLKPERIIRKSFKHFSKDDAGIGWNLKDEKFFFYRRGRKKCMHQSFFKKNLLNWQFWEQGNCCHNGDLRWGTKQWSFLKSRSMPCRISLLRLKKDRIDVKERCCAGA